MPDAAAELARTCTMLLPRALHVALPAYQPLSVTSALHGCCHSGCCFEFATLTALGAACSTYYLINAAAYSLACPGGKWRGRVLRGSSLPLPCRSIPDHLPTNACGLANGSASVVVTCCTCRVHTSAWALSGLVAQPQAMALQRRPHTQPAGHSASNSHFVPAAFQVSQQL
jgi:hypothetical protein